MKRALLTLGWLVALVAFGAAAMLGGSAVTFHHVFARAQDLQLAGIGAEFGADLFIIGFCFALLPGARRPPHTPQPFGWVQGAWGIAGFAVTQIAGSLLITNLASIEQFGAIAWHTGRSVDFSGHDFLLTTALGGELMAALWVAWYLRRLGPARTSDGSPSGVAWRPAPAAGYFSALIAAGIIIALVMAMYHFIPPDMKKLQSLPMAKLFGGTGIEVLPLLAIAVFIGPVLEEFVFRGIGFAGLAARLGPVAAGVITTIVFMAAHAQEKIHYLPGFIDVGLLAATSVVLRLRYRSIRPGILLHIVYNAGSMIAAAFIG